MSAPSPYDDPIPHGWRLVCASLRIAVSLMCWGLALERLSSGAESSTVALLVSQNWLPEDLVPQVSDWAAYALIACGLVTLLRPCWPVLLPVVAWVAGNAAVPAALQEDPVQTLDLTVLVFAPLVLLLIDFWPPPLKFSLGRARFALGLLRVAIVISLMAQAGLFVREIGASAEFSDSLRAAMGEVSAYELKEPMTSRALAGLAAANAAFGLVILTSRQRSVLFCAALWSCAVAAIPVVVEGLPGGPAVMIDAPRVGAPFALCWFWVLAIKEQGPTIVPG